MKIYIIQEDYGCQEESAFGEMSDVERKDVTAVCLSREAMLKALADCIAHNTEEYYNVGIDDYEIHEVEVGEQGYTTSDYQEFSFTKLTDEERNFVKSEVERLNKEFWEQFKKGE